MTLREDELLLSLSRLMEGFQHLMVPGEAGLERSGVRILHHLATQGPQRSSDIARAFRLHRSTITRQVQALEDHGYLIRCRDRDDPTVVRLEASPTGVTLVEQVRGHQREQLTHAIGPWSEDERVAFGRQVDDLADALERMGDGDSSLRPNMKRPRP